MLTCHSYSLRSGLREGWEVRKESDLVWHKASSPGRQLSNHQVTGFRDIFTVGSLLLTCWIHLQNVNAGCACLLASDATVTLSHVCGWSRHGNAGPGDPSPHARLGWGTGPGAARAGRCSRLEDVWTVLFHPPTSHRFWQGSHTHIGFPKAFLFSHSI